MEYAFAYSQASMQFRILVLTLIAAAAPAHAEFVLLSTPPAEAGASGTPPSAASARPKTKPPIRRKPPAPEPAAMGFGDQIPLSFAVRQIVPARFQVAFGKEVDREERVNWKGGKPWRSVLSEAIKPFGLTIAVRGLTVTIVAADSAN
jgi:hypothetical protein